MEMKKIYQVVHAVVGTKLFVIPDLAMEKEDIVQELAILIWEKSVQGKFLPKNLPGGTRPEDLAWKICSDALVDMFRDWDRRPTILSLDKILEDAPEEVMGYDDLFPQTFEEIEDMALENIVSAGVMPALDMLATLDVTRGHRLQTLQVQVVGNEIADAARAYRWEIREIETYGYAPLTHRDKRFRFILVGSRITYPFLARLTKALIAFGATHKMAAKIIQVGLRVLRNGYELTEKDSALLRNYRNRAGANIRWMKHPKGDMTLVRGNLRLFVEV